MPVECRWIGYTAVDEFSPEAVVRTRDMLREVILSGKLANATRFPGLPASLLSLTRPLSHVAPFAVRAPSEAWDLVNLVASRPDRTEPSEFAAMTTLVWCFKRTDSFTRELQADPPAKPIQIERQFDRFWSSVRQAANFTASQVEELIPDPIDLPHPLPLTYLPHESSVPRPAPRLADVEAFIARMISGDFAAIRHDEKKAMKLIEIALTCYVTVNSEKVQHTLQGAALQPQPASGEKSLMEAIVELGVELRAARVEVKRRAAVVVNIERLEHACLALESLLPEDDRVFLPEPRELTPFFAGVRTKLATVLTVNPFARST